MKKTHLTLIAPLLILISSCTQMDRARSLKAPVVLTAKSTAGSIVITGSDGKFAVIPEEYYYSKAISESYEIGDTIRY